MKVFSIHLKKSTPWLETETFRRFLCINMCMLKRPMCKICEKNYCAVNYIRDGVRHYRSICDNCGKDKSRKRPKVFSWEKAGYKKSPTCNNCGFRATYSSQLLVFHIDGNLTNTTFNNLRTICLNCVEVVKRREVNWKRGDLQVDY